MALENILSQEMIQRIGWTLLHFVWQATAVALLLAILLAVLRKATANVRYIMACVALGLIVLMPIATMSLVPVSSPQSIADVGSPPAPFIVPVQPTTGKTADPRTKEFEEPVKVEFSNTAPAIPWKQRAIEKLETSLPYLVTGWLIGIFWLSLWHLGGWAQLQRLKRHMIQPVDASLQAQLNELATRLRVSRAVRLLESALVQVPTVVGWLRPMILLPACALTGLTTEQLEALLAHELAHIRRYDYLVNIMQTIVETLGFYHPAVWWISHKICLERENCCDDLAVSLSGDRVRYARALASMEEIRSDRNELAIAATGGNLFGRIRRLVGKNASDGSRAGWIPSVITILLIAIIAIPASIALNNNVRTKAPKGSIAPNKVVLKLVDPNSQPVVSARVGTSAEWSDTLKNPPKWFLRDGGLTRATKVKSDKYGKVTLEEGDVFWSVPPREQKAPITVTDKNHSLAALQELLREDLGTEVKLTLQPACRVHGRLTTAAARKRHLSPNNLNVWVYWRVHTPFQYVSKQGRFDFVLPPGEYKLRFFSGNPNNSVSFTLPILIKPGQRDLDLTGYLDGTSTLPETKMNRRDREGNIDPNKVVLKLVDPNSQPVVGAWVGTYVDWSDIAESPPIWFLKDGSSYKASEIDSAAKVISNKEGKITLTEEELFKPYWPAEKTVPLTAIDAGHYLAGLRELSQNDLGKEVTMTLQQGCRVHGRVTAATARKRKWSTKILTVLVFWHVHWPCQYTSEEGRFEFVLPPGKYEVQVYAEHPDEAVILPIQIKPGQRELDLTGYLDGTSQLPAVDTEPSAQFILNKMLEHRSRVKNLQYVAENHMWRDVDAEQDKIEEQIKRMRERGSSERLIERLRDSLSNVPESRYQISKCTTDNECVKIEQTRGTYDSSGKKIPNDEKYIWAWNGAQETHFHQRGEFPGSVLIKNTPQIATRLWHPWKSSTGTFCKQLEETIAAGKPVSIEQRKDGAYRVAFDYKTSRFVAIVDPSKGYTCTQRENYNKQGLRTSRETAKNEEVAESIWFPVNGQREEYISDGSVSSRSTFQSSQIRINDPAFNASYFDVNIPKGSHVRDFTRHEDQPEVYRYGEPKKGYDEIVQSDKKFIAGFVVDENGLPVPGVRLEVCCHKQPKSDGKFSWTFGDFGIFNAISDSRGRFAIELEEDGFYNLRFSPESYAGILAYDVPVGTKDLKVTLPKGGTISGRVVRIEDGRKVPIPSVEVKVEQSSRDAYYHLGFDRDQKTMTDEQGRFRFDHLRTKMRDTETRYSQQWEYSPRAWTLSCEKASKTVVFYEGANIEDIELVVEPDYSHPTSLIGKRLPSFEGIDTQVNTEGAAGKAILLCFWDINQRSSRNTITELAKRIKEFQNKKVVVLLVHTSEAEPAKLKEWLEENDIPFACGSIKSVAKKEVLFRWGVQAQPWLILTDQQGVVQAEGFSLEQLDEQLREEIESNKGRIEGRIIDIHTGKGISGMAFAAALRDSPASDKKFVCTSGEDGAFSLGALPSGEYLLQGDFPSLEVDVVSGQRIRDVLIGVDRRDDVQAPKETTTEQQSDVKISMGVRVIEIPADAIKEAFEPDESLPSELVVLNGYEIADRLLTLIDEHKDAKQIANPQVLMVNDGKATVMSSQHMMYISGYESAEGEPSELTPQHKTLEVGWKHTFHARTLESSQKVRIELGSWQQKLDFETQQYRPGYDYQVPSPPDIFATEVAANSGEPVVIGRLRRNEPALCLIVTPSVIMAEPQPESQLGKKLPEPANMEVLKQIGKRRALICFWDMNQRPSRNMITELAKRSKELQAKGIFPMLVHTSLVEPAKLNEWLDNREILFSYLSITKAISTQELFRWGVRSQPWLILTNEEGIVQAEGLSLEQLDEKLQESSTDEQFEDHDEKVPATKEYEVVQLSYVNAEEAAERINEALRQMPDIELSKNVLLQPLENTRQLIIFGQPDKREIVKKLIAEIDIPSGLFETRAFRLKYTDADEIKGKIEGSYEYRTTELHEKVKVISYPEFQQVTVIASPENMSKIAKQIAEWDDFRIVKPRIIKLQNSDPAQMAGLLTKLFAEEDGEGVNIRKIIFGEDAEEKHNIVGPLGDHFTFEAVPGTHKIIFISNIAKAYDAVIQWILELDTQKMATKDVKQVREWMAGRVRFDRQVKESEERLKCIGRALLTYANDHDGEYPDMVELHELREYLKTEEFTWPKQYEYLAEGRTTADRPDIVIYHDADLIKYGKGTNVLFNDGHVEFASPERLNDLNINKTSILIQVRILTASDMFMKHIGLDPNSVAGSKGWSDYRVHTSNDSASFIIDPLHADLLVKTAAAHKDAAMLVAPQFCAMDGRPVTIQILDTHEYRLIPSGIEPNNPSGKTGPKPESIKLGTFIRLEPDASSNGKTVDLEFEWEYRRLLGFKKHTGPDQQTQKVPQIAVDSIKTHYPVPDGKTLLIAGKKITESKEKPGKVRLADLPLIGGLFRSPTKTEETRNLLILIKPVINPPKRIQAQRKMETPPPFDPDNPFIKKLEEKLKRSDE